VSALLVGYDPETGVLQRGTDDGIQNTGVLAGISAMPRLPRQLLPGYCYHITTRCNNREFRLTRFECRELLLFAIQQCQEKFGFKLYALCIMSNHVG
jgi:hypothetical protein